MAADYVTGIRELRNHIRAQIAGLVDFSSGDEEQRLAFVFLQNRKHVVQVIASAIVKRQKASSIGKTCREKLSRVNLKPATTIAEYDPQLPG
jgi:hypothetical protein